MILQALYDYYQRKSKFSKDEIAPEGFGYEEIPFLIHISKEGHFVQIEDSRKKDGKRLVAQKFLVPVLSVSKTSGKVAKLLWDNAKYSLGLPDPKKIEDARKDWKNAEKKLIEKCVSEEEIKKIEKEKFIKRLNEINEDSEKCFSLFVRKIEEQKFSNHPSIQSLLCFLKNNPVEQIKNKLGDTNEIWLYISTKIPNITFWIEGDESPIVESLYEKINEQRDVPDSNETDYQAVCLITGEKNTIKQTHPWIKGVKNAQPSGAAIVSFNEGSSTSFNKKQNFNAPVSKSATFAYTTALNTMLDKMSRNKMQVGDMTMVFWSEKSTPLEDLFCALWSLPEKDNPDADIDAVRKLYNSIESGVFIEDSSTRFYILGLSPNDGRLAIRYWQIGTINDISCKLKQHFDGIDIVKSTEDNGRCALQTMLNSLVRDPKKIPPNLCGDMVKAALQETPYPQSLLQMILQRIRTDFSANPSDERMRNALLKAFLNRNCKTLDKEMKMSLDSENTNIGYRLGRLFAVFEYVQRCAIGKGVKSTIKDRFYGAASATPNVVFSQLLKLYQHHLEKLTDGGKYFYDNIVSEIMADISSVGFPAYLSLENQGRFAIGYYHQKIDLQKKQKKDN